MGLSGVGSEGTAVNNLDIDFEDGNYTIEGQPASEAEVNEVLAPNGITATDGVYASQDGFNIDAANSDVVTDFDGPTPLPDVEGSDANLVNLQGVTSGLEEISDGALMWAAMSEMAKVSQREMADARELKNTMVDSKMQAKENQIDETENKINAMKNDAALTLATSVVSAIVTSNLLTGFQTQGLSGALGQVVTAGSSYYSAAAGPKETANQAELMAKRHELEEAQADDMVESAKADYEGAKEQFKKALRILVEHMELQSQIVQKITS